MRRSRRLYAQREAVVDDDLRLTYEQFFARCDRWSSALQRMGVRKGDRVAYIAPNTHAQLESFYAVPQTGAVLVPINYRLTPAAFDRPAVAETDLLTINYTSGTTSRPKGVMITHRNAYLNTVGTLIHHPMTCADRYLWTLPMFHANGWTFVWIVTAAGGTHVCLRKVDPAAVFAAIG